MPDVLHRAIGRKVRSRREKRSYTQDELSKRVHISRTSLTNLERGRQRMMVEQLYRIAQALDVRPEELLPSALELAEAEIKESPDSDVPLSVQKFVDKVTGGAE